MSARRLARPSALDPGVSVVCLMDRAAAERTVELFLRRGQLEAVESAGSGAARACLERSHQRLAAVSVLLDAEMWQTAFTTAYDAYRTAADAIVLLLGYPDRLAARRRPGQFQLRSGSGAWLKSGAISTRSTARSSTSSRPRISNPPASRG